MNVKKQPMKPTVTMKTVTPEDPATVSAACGPQTPVPASRLGSTLDVGPRLGHMPRVEDLLAPADCDWEPSWMDDMSNTIDWAYFEGTEEEAEPSEAWLELYSFLYWE